MLYISVTHTYRMSSQWIRGGGENQQAASLLLDNLNMLWGNSTLCWHSQGTLQACLGGEAFNTPLLVLPLFSSEAAFILLLYNSDSKTVLEEQNRFTQMQLMALMGNHSAHNSLYSFRSVYALISALHSSAENTLKVLLKNNNNKNNLTMPSKLIFLNKNKKSNRAV